MAASIVLSSLANVCRGCVTPQVLHNWAEDSGMDMDLVDGYDTLPPSAQEKVKRSLEEKHVDDEDWNGVGSSPFCVCYMFNNV